MQLRGRVFDAIDVLSTGLMRVIDVTFCMKRKDVKLNGRVRNAWMEFNSMQLPGGVEEGRDVYSALALQ